MQNETQLFSVILLETRDDGTIGLGNTIEVSAADAIRMIEDKEAKATDAPIGVVPSSLKPGKVKAVGE